MRLSTKTSHRILFGSEQISFSPGGKRGDPRRAGTKARFLTQLGAERTYWVRLRTPGCRRRARARACGLWVGSPSRLYRVLLQAWGCEAEYWGSPMVSPARCPR